MKVQETKITPQLSAIGNTKIENSVEIRKLVNFLAVY